MPLFASSITIQFSGFIAQQVDSAAQQIGYDFSGVDKNGTLMGLRYSEFVTPLVKAVQELSKKADSLQKTVDSLTTVPIKRMAQNNDSLAQELTKLKEIVNQCCTANSTKQTGNNGRNNNNTKENSIPVELRSADDVILYQNIPNPFGDETNINYYLPELVNDARMIFYDNSGRVIKEVELNQKGIGSLTINTAKLASGVYSYSIVVDGKVADTKKMMRNK